MSFAVNFRGLINHKSSEKLLDYPQELRKPPIKTDFDNDNAMCLEKITLFAVNYFSSC